MHISEEQRKRWLPRELANLELTLLHLRDPARIQQSRGQRYMTQRYSRPTGIIHG